MALEFEEILPYVEGEGDTGKTAREKINRNFTKIEPLANVGAEMQQLRQDVTDDLEQLHDDVEEMVDKTTSLFGYYNCSTAGATAAKTVNTTGYELTTGGNTRIKMEHANAAASPVTLQIGSAAAKDLYYNDSPVTDENTWEDNEVIVVYYDGTSYYATNSLGGGKKGDDDLSQFFNVVEEQVGGSSNLLNPADWEVGLLKTDGTINSGATTYTTTGYIEVEPEQTYTFFGLISSNNTTPAPVAEIAYVCGYSDIDTLVGERISYDPYVSVITIPSGVRYVRLSIKKNYSNYGGADRTTHTGLIQGSNLTSGDWEEYSETSIVKHVSLNDNDKSVEQKEDDELITKQNLLDYVADEISKLDIPDVSGITTAVAAIKAKTDLLDVESQQIGGSNNILDPAIIVAGLLKKDNTTVSSSAYCHTGLIAVEEESVYTFFGRTSYNDTSSIPKAEVKVVCYFNENEELINGEQFDTNQSQISVGAGVRYIKICINKDYTNWGGADRTAYTGLFKGNNLTGDVWEEYSESTTIQSLVYNANTPISNKQAKELVVKNDLPVQEEEGEEEYPITMTYTKGTGNNIDTFRVSDSNGNSIGCTFDKWNKDNYYGGNHIFNFLDYTYKSIVVPATDDVAPMHVKSSVNTIGGNHAVQCQVVTANSHGLSNSDVGNNITSPNNELFVIARVVDNNTFWVLPLDKTAYGSFNFGSGTATYNGNSIVVTSSVNTNTNLVPTNSVLLQKVYVDGKDVDFTESKTINAKIIEFVETYNIVDADYAKNYLSVEDGKVIYDSPAHIIVENIYRFMQDSKVVVVSNVMFGEKCYIVDVMFNQVAAKIPLSYNKSTSKFYVPGSKGFVIGNTSYNYAEPAYFEQPAANANYEFNIDTFADANKPVTRIIQISSDDVGFAFGYLPIGVGADLMKYTSTPMVLYNTAKIYPHGVDKAGLIANNKDDDGDIPANSVYNAVLYRVPFDAANQGTGRICLYDVDYDGYKYVFVDYNQTISDHIEFDDSLDGHYIEIVEQRNAFLISPVYNGGFYVNATHVDGDSSYCVVKIKL